MKRITFAERVSALLKLTGTAALALAFIAVMAGCGKDAGSKDVSGGGEDAGEDVPDLQVSIDDLAINIADLPVNDSGNPYIVKLDKINITAGEVMTRINEGIANRYVIMDLSDCYASNYTIKGSDTPGPNDMNLIKDNQYIVGVVLPGDLTSIGNKAFYQCVSLTRVTLPKGVASIGDSVFEGCYSLTSAILAGSVNSIGDKAFYGCESLGSVTLPGSVSFIGNKAFYGCGNLIFTVTGTGRYRAFDNGKMLLKNNNELAAYPSARGTVALPGSVTAIGNNAFSGCDLLTSVTIPGIAAIGSEAFSNCIGLSSVTIPANVTTIGSGAFSNCISLTSVTFAAEDVDFSVNAFPGDQGDADSLHAKYTAAAGGGAGTYTIDGDGLWTVVVP